MHTVIGFESELAVTSSAPVGKTLGTLWSDISGTPALKQLTSKNPDVWTVVGAPVGESSGLTSAQIVDLLYPVGALYISTLSTNPGTLFGRGTWTAFGAGRTLVGLDTGDASFDTVEETGGSKTVASAGTVAAPVFTGSALATHSHTAGTLAPSAHSGTAVADHSALTNNHTGVTVANHTDVLNHVHGEQLQGGTTGATTGTHIMASTATGGALRTSGQSTLNPTANGTAAQVHTVGQPTAHGAISSHSVTQPSAHTMSGDTQAITAGTPTGTNSAPAYTGSTTSVVQPYIVTYMFKRTA